MSRKTFLTLFASVMLSATFAPHAALAQFGFPPGPPPALAGPPPGLGAGGPPFGGALAGPVAGLPPRGLAGPPPAGGPRLDGAAGLRGLDRGGPASFRGIEGRAGAYGASSHARNSYASYGYGRGYGRGYRSWPYAAAAAYAYSGPYASSDEGCTYVSSNRRYRSERILVCHGD